MEKCVIKNGKVLRCGITTGTCAAAGAKAATSILLGESVENVTSAYIMTPAGIGVNVPIVESIIDIYEDTAEETNKVTCIVKKDAGDDPDITDGILIYVSAINDLTEVVR